MPTPRRDDATRVLRPAFTRDLRGRRTLEIELPEFLARALEARVAEANEGADAADRSTLAECIESELVNLLTLRDVLELDARLPGFADAVQSWINEVRRV